jgi:hypothetical protein
MNLFGHSVGLLEWGISPTQGLYLHRTTQHRKTRTHIHVPSGIRTCDYSVLVRALDGAAIGTGTRSWNWSFSPYQFESSGSVTLQWILLPLFRIHVGFTGKFLPGDTVINIFMSILFSSCMAYSKPCVIFLAAMNPTALGKVIYICQGIPYH